MAADPEQENLRQLRADLVADLHESHDASAILDFQRRLARAIHETEAKDRSSKSLDLAWHLHRLRCLGDGLVWSILPSHLIRTLRRHPGHAASLLGQGKDFGFVFQVAEEVAAAGFIPIVIDLTHVLRTGDVVAVKDNHVLILECKNSPLPRRWQQSGRRFRQRSRGEDRSRYLRDSKVIESDGTWRLALPLGWPSPRWDCLQEAAALAAESDDRFGVASLGTRDWLVALRRAGDQVPRAFEQHLNSVTPTVRWPVLGTHMDLFDEPSEVIESPLAYPIPLAIKQQLFDGSMLIVRQIDLSLLEGDIEVSNTTGRLTITDPQDYLPIVLTVGSETLNLSHHWLNAILRSPRSILAIRNTIARGAELALAGAAAEPMSVPSGLIAPGDAAAYGTVYRGPTGEPILIVPAAEFGVNSDDLIVMRSPSRSKPPANPGPTDA